MRGTNLKFTLLDMTKEIPTTLDNLINVVDDSTTYTTYFSSDPHCNYRYNIEEVDSDQTFFLKIKTIMLLIIQLLEMDW